MQCPKCKSDWNVSTSILETMPTNCSFCSDPLAEEKPEPEKPEPEKPETIPDVLKMLVGMYGKDVYCDGNRLKVLLSDYAVPFEKECKHINLAIVEKIPEKLYNADSKDKYEKNAVMQNSKHKLMEICDMPEKTATELVNWFVVALDWQITLTMKTEQSEQKPITVQIPNVERTIVISEHSFNQTRKGLIETVLVKAGSFNMGSNDGHNWEKPVHTVTLTNDYYMGKYEVTQKQYYEVMKTKPSNNAPSSGWENLPVERVSWYDAVKFCNALSEMEGVALYYRINGTNVTIVAEKGKGYRLPTEAEWEYGAIGGMNGNHNLAYAGSNTLGEVAWYYGNSGNKTHEVGKKQANDLGLYDMSGNVWEWCWDWYDDYSRGNSTNPIGSTGGSYRVDRGGSCFYSADRCRIANRYGSDPSYCTLSLGFRVVCFQ